MLTLTPLQAHAAERAIKWMIRYQQPDLALDLVERDGTTFLHWETSSDLDLRTFLEAMKFSIYRWQLGRENHPATKGLPKWLGERPFAAYRDLESKLRLEALHPFAREGP